MLCCVRAMATALWKAVKEADVEQLEQLIKDPSEANVFNKKGETPLIIAVQNGTFTGRIFLHRNSL